MLRLWFLLCWLSQYSSLQQEIHLSPLLAWIEESVRFILFSPPCMASLTTCQTSTFSYRVAPLMFAQARHLLLFPWIFPSSDITRPFPPTFHSYWTPTVMGFLIGQMESAGGRKCLYLQEIWVSTHHTTQWLFVFSTLADHPSQGIRGASATFQRLT